MKCGTLILTMRKMRAETWPFFELIAMRKMRAAGTRPSFERDGPGPRQNTAPTYRERRRSSSVDAARTRKIRGMGAELSALSIADAVGASNEPPKRRRVYISVYTLFGDLTSNALLLSLTGGGLYHSGIEIEGVEYAFGGGPGGGSGVWRQPPRALPPGFSFKNSSYKESLDMGTTRPLTSAELHRTIVDMEHALSWRKNQYNMLTRNWCVALARRRIPLSNGRPGGAPLPSPPGAMTAAPHHDSDRDAPTWRNLG